MGEKGVKHWVLELKRKRGTWWGKEMERQYGSGWGCWRGDRREVGIGELEREEEREREWVLEREEF